jgi:hypothetical protein
MKISIVKKALAPQDKEQDEELARKRQNQNIFMEDYPKYSR